MATPYQFYIIPISSVLTVLSAIACLASKSTASYSYNEATGGGTMTSVIMLDAEFPDQRIALATYPYYLGLNATTPILVASSIVLVISIGFAAFSARVMLKCKPVKQERAHFSLSYRSLNGDFGYGDVYAGGVFDLETWTCEVKNLPSFRDVSAITQKCAAEVAGRACTAVMFIFAIVLFMAVWWDAKKHRALIVVEWDGHRMAWDDEDDCELDNVAATRQLGHISLRSNRA